MSNTGKNKPVIGLLGGVGSGKSTVADELARLGCVVVDADAIGHDVLCEPEVREDIGRRWGEGVMTSEGRVDRAALGRAVFADESQIQELNRLLHPRIRARAEKQIDRALGDTATPAVVLDAPVLLEAGWDDLCTACVFVDSPEQQRRRRVAESRGWDEQTWRRREKMQIPLDKKANRCQYKVENSSSVSHLRKQAHVLFQEIVGSAGRS